MAFFDWFRKPAKPQAPPEPERVERPAEPAAAPRAPDSTVVVPEGHVLKLFRPSHEPQLVRSDGGVWVADFGRSSDDSLAEVEKLLDEVDAAIARSSGAALLATDAGLLSDLFAPHNPRVMPTERVLVWAGAPQNLSPWLDDPRRTAALLRRLHRLRASRAHPVTQWFYIDKAAGDDAALLASLLEGIGVSVRTPGEDGVLLAEVRRPEGVVLSVLAGARWSEKAPEEAPLLALQRARDEAEMLGDAERLRQLEQQESAQLTQRIYGAGKTRAAEPVVRAPRLRRLLLESIDTGEKRALHEELRRRAVPFFVLAGPNGQLSPRGWGEWTGLAAHPDLSSMQKTVRDLGLQPGSYRIAVVGVRDLCKIAAHNDVGIALNVYRAPDEPLYVLLDVDAARALEKGKMPGATGE